MILLHCIVGWFVFSFRCLISCSCQFCMLNFLLVFIFSRSYVSGGCAPPFGSLLHMLHCLSIIVFFHLFRHCVYILKWICYREVIQNWACKHFLEVGILGFACWLVVTNSYYWSLSVIHQVSDPSSWTQLIRVLTDKVCMEHRVDQCLVGRWTSVLTSTTGDNQSAHFPRMLTGLN